MENSSQVTRVYRLKWWGWAFPLICLAVGSYSTVGLMTGRLHPGRRFGMFSAVSVLVGGVLFTVAASTTTLILTGDAIELRNFFERKRLTLSEIRGRREIINATRLILSDSWKLEPKDSKARPIYIGNSFNLDEVFYAWMDQIPDLDEDDVSDPCA